MSHSLTAQDYGYAPGIEFFSTQTGLMRRFEGHFPNKMAMSRFLASDRLKSVGRNGALAFKTSDIEEVLAEKRREVVSSVMSKGDGERGRIIAELAEGHASIGYRATPLRQDHAKAVAQVETMVANAGRGGRSRYSASSDTYSGSGNWNMRAPK